MHRKNTYFVVILLSLFLIQCKTEQKKNEIDTLIELEEMGKSSINLLKDIEPMTESGEINAIIEIPAGTLDKWELDKSTGKISWELIDNKPRVVNYIGYPGNYGMIPGTLLSKDNGGDGDPLDILVLGAPVKRSSVQKCKIIGVLYLQDRGEQDDKLIAVSSDSPMYKINNLEELNSNYNGVAEIIQLWFTNYKGVGKMQSKGYGDKKTAMVILTSAIEEYQVSTTKSN